MTFIECCQKARAEGLQIIRPTQADSGNFEARAFTAPPQEGRGWVYLDAWTAGAVCAVYDALDDSHKAHLEKLPPLAAINICWKLVK